LPVRLIKPFLEAGPSFRDVRLNSADLAWGGFTAGGGVELKPGRLKIGPEIRYTRWGADSRTNLNEFNPVSNLNQAELLLGLSF